LGLSAPYWRSDARGAIVGLSRFNTNTHLARATLESICYQSRDVSEAMEADSGAHLEVLKVEAESRSTTCACSCRPMCWVCQ
jgi:glycerol kinase